MRGGSDSSLLCGGQFMTASSPAPPPSCFLHTLNDDDQMFPDAMTTARMTMHDANATISDSLNYFNCGQQLVMLQASSPDCRLTSMTPLHDDFRFDTVASSPEYCTLTTLASSPDYCLTAMRSSPDCRVDKVTSSPDCRLVSTPDADLFSYSSPDGYIDGYMEPVRQLATSPGSPLINHNHPVLSDQSAMKNEICYGGSTSKKTLNQFQHTQQSQQQPIQQQQQPRKQLHEKHEQRKQQLKTRQIGRSLTPRESPVKRKLDDVRKKF